MVIRNGKKMRWGTEINEEEMDILVSALEHGTVAFRETEQGGRAGEGKRE